MGYPGSGNSWLRMLLDLTTGLHSCSDRSPRHQDGGCVLSLTHHLTMLHRPRSRLASLLQSHGRAVLLIRNPYSAVASAYRHHVLGVHSGSDIRIRVKCTTPCNP